MDGRFGDRHSLVADPGPPILQDLLREEALDQGMDSEYRIQDRVWQVAGEFRIHPLTRSR